MESENELTRVEVVLHNFNRSAIDTFLVSNGIEVQGESWERKIKLVLLVIEEVQRGIRKEKNAKK